MNTDIITFLTIDEVIALQIRQIKRFGGMPGIRDIGLLESAVFSPQQTFGGVSVFSNVYEIAAAYALYLIKNHPFVDGNKRVGMYAAFTFLRSNDISVNLTQDQVYELSMSIAQSKIEIEDIAKTFRNNSYAIK